MTIVRECEMCGKIDREFGEENRWCDNCQQIRFDIRKEQYDEVKQEFEACVAAQLSVINLLLWLQKDKPRMFERAFGSQGTELLQSAVQDLKRKDP